MSTPAATAPATADSHRERKKRATHRALHEAAFELVDANGLSATTVEAISDRAGVAPRTFWAYFASKEEAVVDWDPDRTAELRDALLGRGADEDILVSLRLVLERFVEDRVRDTRLAVRRHRLIRREPHLMATVAAEFDELERTLVSAVADKLGLDPDRGLRPAILVMAACGACRVAERRWADLGGRKPFSDLLDEAFVELAEGLTPFTREGRCS